MSTPIIPGATYTRVWLDKDGNRCEGKVVTVFEFVDGPDQELVVFGNCVGRKQARSLAWFDTRYERVESVAEPVAEPVERVAGKISKSVHV